jgi:hypothetical protein
MFLDMIKSFVFDKYEIINDLLQHLQFHHVIYIKSQLKKQIKKFKWILDQSIKYKHD